MYLLPILRKEISTELSQFWLFLEGNGTRCMEFSTKEEMIECARDSGFTGEIRQSTAHPTLWIIVVDPLRSALADFYTWNEVTPHAIPLKEVWRPYIWCKGDSLGVNGWLKDIEIAPAISLYSLLQSEA